MLINDMPFFLKSEISILLWLCPMLFDVVFWTTRPKMSLCLLHLGPLVDLTTSRRTWMINVAKMFGLLPTVCRFLQSTTKCWYIYCPPTPFVESISFKIDEYHLFFTSKWYRFISLSQQNEKDLLKKLEEIYIN